MLVRYALFVLLSACCAAAAAPMLDLRADCAVVADARVSERAAAAARSILGMVVNDRLGPGGGGAWGSATAQAATGQRAVRLAFRAGAAGPSGEGFALRADAQAGTVSIESATDRGFIMGAGRLSRELRVDWRDGGAVLVPRALRLRVDPPVGQVRGHQIPTPGGLPFPRRTAGAFSDWSNAERYVKQLVTFGTNQIEFAHIALGPEGADDTKNLRHWSSVLNMVDVNCSLWFPLTLFTDQKPGYNGTTKIDELFRGMERLDSVFVPGGDGGSDGFDQQLLTNISKLSAVLRQKHPSATMWLSAQEYAAADLDAFFSNVSLPATQAFLDGVVYGPHVRVPYKEFVARASAAGVAVRQYPDITHSLGAQLPVPAWHYAWQLTHGRQNVSPQPVRHSDIVNLRRNGSTASVGFGAYSEGVNDDYNKCLWSAMSMEANLTLEDFTSQYARAFFGEEHERAMSDALFSLEENWVGDAGENDAVWQTLFALQAVEKAANASGGLYKADWRLPMYLYRGYYDSYIQTRLRFERKGHNAAKTALSEAELSTPDIAMGKAKKAIDDASLAKFLLSGSGKVLRDRVLSLRDVINNTAELCPGCMAGGAGCVDRQKPDMSVDSMDVPLTDNPYYKAQIAEIEKLPNNEQKLKRIQALLAYDEKKADSEYDWLGGVLDENHEHLDPGQGPTPDSPHLTDPSFYFSPLQSTKGCKTDACRSTTRLKSQTMAHTFYDAPLRLTYEVDGLTQYKLQLAFVDYSHKDQPVQIMANEKNISAWFLPNADAEQGPITELQIPASATANASKTHLHIACHVRRGKGGTGRNCKLSEVWLVPTTRHDTTNCPPGGFSCEGGDPNAKTICCTSTQTCQGSHTWAPTCL